MNTENNIVTQNSKKKTLHIWIIVIASILGAITLFIVVNSMRIPHGTREEVLERVDSKLYNEEVDLNDISDENAGYFIGLLDYLEQELAGEEYVFESIYEVNFEGAKYSVAAKVILKEDLEIYTKTVKEQSLDKDLYEIIFSYNSPIDKYNGYDNRTHAEDYIEDLKKEFTDRYNDCYLNGYYLVIRHYNVNGGNNWQETLNKIPILSRKENKINILVPANTTESEANKVIENIEDLIKKYSISSINVYEVKEEYNDYAVFKEDEHYTGNSYKSDEEYYNNVYYYGF